MVINLFQFFFFFEKPVFANIKKMFKYEEKQKIQRNKVQTNKFSLFKLFANLLKSQKLWIDKKNHFKQKHKQTFCEERIIPNFLLVVDVAKIWIEYKM